MTLRRPPVRRQPWAMGDEEKKEGGEHINLKVVTQDGNEIYFKCKQTTPLKKLMDAFCNRQGVSSNSVRFLFDGNRINETQTPQQVRCPSVAWSLSCAAALHSLALPPLRRTQSSTPLIALTASHRRPRLSPDCLCGLAARHGGR